MIATPVPEAPNRRGTVALVLASVSLLLSLLTCTGALLSGDIDLLPVQSEPSIASASQVEAVAHVTLRPGTVLLSAVYSNGLETMLSAKFRMPRGEYDAFVAAAKFTAPVEPGLRAVTAKHNVGGGNLWDPESATTVAGVAEQQPTADGTHRTVMFDLGATDTVTVYLHASRN